MDSDTQQNPSSPLPTKRDPNKPEAWMDPHYERKLKAHQYAEMERKKTENPPNKPINS